MGIPLVPLKSLLGVKFLITRITLFFNNKMDIVYMFVEIRLVLGGVTAMGAL